MAPSCPLHWVASGLGSVGTWSGGTSSATQHQDPLLLSKCGHPKRLLGTPLPCPMRWQLHKGPGRQGEEGTGAVPGLPCPAVGHHPLRAPFVVPGEGGGPCRCPSSAREQQRCRGTGSCPCPQVAMPHQWLEGNLPVSARCAVCDRTCGSVRRLQDWRCLWCKAIVRMCPSL